MIVKNSKRQLKRFSKDIEEINAGYNFDRLLDNINKKAFKNLKQLFDIKNINTVLDYDQKLQLKKVTKKSGMLEISDSIQLNRKEPKKVSIKTINLIPVETPWTVQENQILFKAYKSLGPNWIDISSLFPSRFSRGIKSHFLEVLK